MSIGRHGDACYHRFADEHVPMRDHHVKHRDRHRILDGERAIPLIAFLLVVALPISWMPDAHACGYWTLQDAELARDVEFLCAGVHIRRIISKRGIIAGAPIRGDEDLYTFEWKDDRHEAWQRVAEVKHGQLIFRGRTVGSTDKENIVLDGEAPYRVTLSPNENAHRIDVTVQRNNAIILVGQAFGWEGKTPGARLNDIRNRIALYIVWRRLQLLPSLHQRRSATAPELIRQISRGQPRERMAAALRLARLGPEVLSKLLELIIDARRDEEARLEAIFAVGMMGPAAASAIRVLDTVSKEPVLTAAAQAAIRRLKGDKDTPR